MGEKATEDVAKKCKSMCIDIQTYVSPCKKLTFAGEAIFKMDLLNYYREIASPVSVSTELGQRPLNWTKVLQVMPKAIVLRNQQANNSLDHQNGLWIFS